MAQNVVKIGPDRNCSNKMHPTKVYVELEGLEANGLFLRFDTS